MCTTTGIQTRAGKGVQPALLMKSSATARSASSASSVALAFMIDMPRPTCRTSACRMRQTWGTRAGHR